MLPTIFGHITNSAKVNVQEVLFIEEVARSDGGVF